jgi:protein TonB
MHATFDQFGSAARSVPIVDLFPSQPPVAEPAIPVDWRHGGGYRARRISPTTIGAILLFHAGLLGAAIKLDVLPAAKPASPPLVITLIPEQVAPAPAPREKEVAPADPVKPRMVAPDPLVVVPQQAPVAIAAVPEAPPQAIVTAAAPAAPAAPPSPAPITPPDASAASLKNPAPRYPVESRRKREEGAVRLRVVISADGRVKDISVARSSGFERLDAAALDTVRKWKFQPGMQAGSPVEAIGFLTIPFKIAD